MMEINSVNYRGISYMVASIPNVFYDMKEKITLGTESLNKVLFDDSNGYQDEEARWIDEFIYAYIDDEYFNLNEKSFIEKAKRLLD